MVSCLQVLLPRLNELLRHLSYGVRFEAAVTMESLCHALPHLSSSLLQQTITAIRAQYEALALLSSANTTKDRYSSSRLDLHHLSLFKPRTHLPHPWRL